MQKVTDNFTLLLVDDNPTNLLLLAKIIEFDLPQVRVLTARSAKTGLELAQQHVIEGAFIDVQMPQMDGLEMCRQLRRNARTARIPLVLMTAHVSAPELRAEGLELGAYDFISQPIDNVEMLARIKVMLRLCEHERNFSSGSDLLEQQLEDYSANLRWLSGLLLSGEGNLAELDVQWVRQLAAELPTPVEENDRQFFNKLARDFPLPWRRTLLKLSLFNSLPLALAEKLSEIEDVSAGLAYLNRHKLALIEHRNHQDHLSFRAQTRALLREKAKLELTAQEQHQVYQIAADWYRQQEDYLAVLTCLIAAGEFAAVSQLLSQVGLELFELETSQRQLLIIDEIADDLVAECGWLSLFRGINRLYALSHDAEVWLELSYRLFSNVADIRGMLLVRSQQILFNYYIDGSWQRWSSQFASFRDEVDAHKEWFSPCELLELAYAKGVAKLAFADQLERMESLIVDALAIARRHNLRRHLLKLNLLQSRFAVQQGRFLVVHSAFEQALKLHHQQAEQTDPLEQLMICMVACELLYTSGNLSELQHRRTFGSDCAISRQRRTVLEVMQGYYAATLLVAKGNHQLAEDLIEMTLLSNPVAKAPHLQSLLVQLRGWLRALCGDRMRGLNDLETALQLRQQAGGRLFRLVNLLLAATTCLALDLVERAGNYLNEALELSCQVGEERVRIGIHAWLAVVWQRLGETQRQQQHLQLFFDLLQRQRNLFFPGLAPALLEQLLPMVSETKERKLLEPLVKNWLSADLDGDNRPLASIRIDCLGTFAVCRDGVRCEMHQVGQGSRQLLALLIMSPTRALSSEIIMGQLWPDSSPAKARSSFDTAHARLRKALEEVFGDDVRSVYLVLEKGMLSLRHVRIDAVEYSDAMKTAQYHLQRENYWQAEQVLWRMDYLWQGEFLSGYDLGENLPHHRERLNQLRMEQLDQLSRLLIRRRQDNEACLSLQAALALDPTQDFMVRSLLKIYRKRRDFRGVAQVLDDYRGALQRELYEKEEIDELIESLQHPLGQL